MPKRSDPTSNAEIVRNAQAPFGFGRRPAVCFVAAPRRCARIAVAAASCSQSGGAPNAAPAIPVPGR